MTTPKAPLHERLSPELVALHEALMQLTCRLPNRDPRRWVGLSDAGIESRDAIIQRARATVWHVALLEERSAAATEHMNEDLVSAIETTSEPHFSWAVQRDLSHLLDDLVFNAVSLLDYASNLWACLFDLDPMQRHTWLRSAKRAQKVLSRASTDYPAHLAGAIVAADEKWVRRLDGYRGVLIHREVGMGSGVCSFNPLTMKGRLSFHLPKALVSAVREILPGQEPVDLFAGAEMIAGESLRLVTNLVRVVTPGVMHAGFGTEVVAGRPGQEPSV